MNNAPTKPIDSYQVAELPPVPSAGIEGQPEAVAAPVTPPEPEIAVLDFIDPSAISETVPLKFGFWWEGRKVLAITGRRLAVAEVGQVADRMVEARRFSRYDFYAAMTGFPASVIRGLINEDGEALIEKLAPFLPRSVYAVPEIEETEPAETTTVMPEPSLSTMPSEDGGDTPSPAAEL